MTNVHTLQDINSKGHRLGSVREEELEKKLHSALKSIDETNDLSKKLLDKNSDLEKSFNQEKEAWALERKDMKRRSAQNNKEIQRLRTQSLETVNMAKQLQNENTNLISQNTEIYCSLKNYKVKTVAKTNEIKQLQGEIKLLKGELNLYIKNSTKKDYEVLSLKTKLFELEIELEHLKSEALSRRSRASSPQLNLPDQEKPLSEKSVSGGDDHTSSAEIQENVSEIHDTPVDSKPKENLYEYLHKDIQDNLCSKTNNIISPDDNKPDMCNISSETNNDNIISPDNKQNSNSYNTDVPDSSPQIMEQEKLDPSLSKSNSGISNQRIEAIPVAVSVLGGSKIPSFASQIIAWILLGLLIIIVLWFRIIRPIIRENRKKKKNESLNFTWVN